MAVHQANQGPHMKKHINDTLILWSQGITIIVLLTIMLAMSSCTVVRYQSTERTLTVVDLHPGGESLVLDGVLTNIGRVSVNRDTSDSSAVVGAVVDAAVGL